MTLLPPMYAQPQTPFVVMPRGIGYPITRYEELEMEDEGGNNRLIKLQNAFLSAMVSDAC